MFFYFSSTYLNHSPSPSYFISIYPTPRSSFFFYLFYIKILCLLLFICFLLMMLYIDRLLYYFIYAFMLHRHIPEFSTNSKLIIKNSGYKIILNCMYFAIKSQSAPVISALFAIYTWTFPTLVPFTPLPPDYTRNRSVLASRRMHYATACCNPAPRDPLLRRKRKKQEANIEGKRRRRLPLADGLSRRRKEIYAGTVRLVLRPRLPEGKFVIGRSARRSKHRSADTVRSRTTLTLHPQSTARPICTCFSGCDPPSIGRVGSGKLRRLCF